MKLGCLIFHSIFREERKILNGGHAKIVIDSPRQFWKELGGKSEGERGFTQRENREKNDTP